MTRINKLIFIIPFVLFIGCAHKQPKETSSSSNANSNVVSLEQLAQDNQANINSKLTVGMSKALVVEVMGNKTAMTNNGVVSNPFRSETFQDKSGAQMEILYYVTEKNRPFQPLKDAQMTPLIIKNGMLTGWGAISLARSLGQSTE